MIFKINFITIGLSSSECLKKSFETHSSVAVLYRNEVSVHSFIQSFTCSLMKSEIQHTLEVELDPFKSYIIPGHCKNKPSWTMGIPEILCMHRLYCIHYLAMSCISGVVNQNVTYVCALHMPKC